MELADQNNEQSTSVTHRKKPSGSVSTYLGSRVLNLLNLADAEPDAEKRAEILETVRKISGYLRRRDGESFWWSVGFAACMAVIFGAFLIAKSPKSYIYTSPENSFRVLREVNPYSFIFQRVENGIPKPASLIRFCDDYRPRISAGETLTLRFGPKIATTTFCAIRADARLCRQTASIPIAGLELRT